MPPFWPGVDRWPPRRWVWVAATVLTILVPVVVYLFGPIGVAAYVGLVVVCAVLGANSRLKNLDGADELRKSEFK